MILNDVAEFAKLLPAFGAVAGLDLGTVTIGVANVVLHVTDDRVVPIGNVQGTVCADDRVGRTKISILTVDQFQSGRSPNLTDFSRPSVAVSVQ